MIKIRSITSDLTHHRPVKPESADIEKTVQYRDIRTELYGSGKIALFGSDVTQ